MEQAQLSLRSCFSPLLHTYSQPGHYRGFSLPGRQGKKESITSEELVWEVFTVQVLAAHIFACVCPSYGLQTIIHWTMKAPPFLIPWKNIQVEDVKGTEKVTENQICFLLHTDCHCNPLIVSWSSCIKFPSLSHESQLGHGGPSAENTETLLVLLAW